VFSFDDEGSNGSDSGENKRRREKVDKLKHLLSDLLGSEGVSESESEELAVPRKPLRTSSLTEMEWSYSAETEKRARKQRGQFKVVVDGMREGDDGGGGDSDDFYENEGPSQWSSTRSGRRSDDSDRSGHSNLSEHSVHSVSRDDDLLFDFSSLVNDLKKANHQ